MTLWVRGGYTFCDKCKRNGEMPANAMPLKEYQKALSQAMALHAKCGVTTPNVIR